MTRLTLLIFGNGYLSVIKQRLPEKKRNDGIWITPLKIAVTADIIRDHIVRDMNDNDNTVIREYPTKSIISLNTSPELPTCLCLYDFDGKDTALSKNFHDELMMSIENLEKKIEIQTQMIYTMEEEMLMTESRFKNRMEDIKRSLEIVGIRHSKTDNELANEDKTGEIEYERQ